MTATEFVLRILSVAAGVVVGSAIAESLWPRRRG